MHTLIKRFLPSDALARHSIILGAGAVSYQAITALSMLLLARLYPAEALGHLAVFVATTGLLASAYALRYELAIPLPEDAKRASQLMIWSILLTLVNSSLTLVVVVFFGEAIARILHFEGRWWVLLLPLGGILTSLNQIFYFYFLRQRQTRLVATARGFQALLTALIQAAAFPLGAGALLTGLIVGQSAQLGILLRKVGSLEKDAFRWSELWAVAIRYKRFPLYYIWSGLLSNFSLQLPLILLTQAFGASAAGYYMLALRFLGAPLSIVGQSIGHAYLVTALQQREQIASLTLRMYTRQILEIVPLCIIVCILGPELTVLLFGETWRTTGELLQWLAPMACITFVATPLTELFTIYEKQHLSTLFQALLLIQRVTSILFLSHTGDMVLTIAVFSGGGVLLWMGLILLTMRMAGNSFSALFSPARHALWWIALAAGAVGVKFASHWTVLGAALLAETLILLSYWRAIRDKTPLQGNHGGEV
jgi:O-antigen/teichoic acid export membrane protein